jgi:hypothetical protein
MKEKRLFQSNPLRVNTCFLPVEVDWDPVAVELDFMEPLVAGGRLGLQRGKLRPDESRHCRRGGHRNNSPRTLDHHATQKASLLRNP